jgi:hypothetical protein
MRILPVLLLAVTLPVCAQTRPANLEPLPEPPPPPPGMIEDSALEPQVTIKRRGEDRVEEYRMNGKLYMIKVTPPGSRPYYLIDDTGGGQFTRRDSLDTGPRPPMWVIHQF